MAILSISKVKLFKACRQAYRFKYIEGLEPVRKADALQVGLNYHSKVEEIYKYGYCSVSDNSRESAMALAYEKYIYPKFNVKSVEDWFKCDLGDDVTLIGRTDGIADDGRLVEHKTTSVSSLEEYEFQLQWDEQILAYMLGTGTREMWYTVIKKPTIRQKKSESDEDFFDRMCKWYDEDTDSKIMILLVTRTDEEIAQFEKELKEMSKMMDKANESENGLYRNTAYCEHWGRRCEYSSICLNYDPNLEYVDFVREK